MAKFRKKPVELEAVQWFQMGDHPAVTEEWMRGDGSFLKDRPGDIDRVVTAQKVPAVKTLEGWHRVTPGDWIITGIVGEVYPCKDAIFRATYDEVTP